MYLYLYNKYCKKSYGPQNTLRKLQVYGHVKWRTLFDPTSSEKSVCCVSYVFFAPKSFGPVNGESLWIIQNSSCFEWWIRYDDVIDARAFTDSTTRKHKTRRSQQSSRPPNRNPLFFCRPIQGCLREFYLVFPPCFAFIALPLS